MFFVNLCATVKYMIAYNKTEDRSQEKYLLGQGYLHAGIAGFLMAAIIVNTVSLVT